MIITETNWEGKKRINVESDLFFGSSQDRYIQLTGDSRINMGTTGFAFSFFMEYSANSYAFQLYGGAPYNVYFLAGLSSMNFVVASTTENPLHQIQYNFASGTYVNTKIFVTCEFDGNSFKLYVNGVLRASTISLDPGNSIFDFSAVNTANYTIGNRVNKADSVDGTLSNFCIFNRALDQTEIDYIYKNGGILPTSSHGACVAHYPLTQQYYPKASASFIAKHTQFALDDLVAFDVVEQYNYAKPGLIDSILLETVPSFVGTGTSISDTVTYLAQTFSLSEDVSDFFIQLGINTSPVNPNYDVELVITSVDGNDHPVMSNILGVSDNIVNGTAFDPGYSPKFYFTNTPLATGTQYAIIARLVNYTSGSFAIDRHSASDMYPTGSGWYSLNSGSTWQVVSGLSTLDFRVKFGKEMASTLPANHAKLVNFLDLEVSSNDNDATAIRDFYGKSREIASGINGANRNTYGTLLLLNKVGNFVIGDQFTISGIFYEVVQTNNSFNNVVVKPYPISFQVSGESIVGSISGATADINRSAPLATRLYFEDLNLYLAEGNSFSVLTKVSVNKNGFGLGNISHSIFSVRSTQGNATYGIRMTINTNSGFVYFTIGGYDSSLVLGFDNVGLDLDVKPGEELYIGAVYDSTNTIGRLKLFVSTNRGEKYLEVDTDRAWRYFGSIDDLAFFRNVAGSREPSYLTAYKFAFLDQALTEAQIRKVRQALDTENFSITPRAFYVFNRKSGDANIPNLIGDFPDLIVDHNVAYNGNTLAQTDQFNEGGGIWVDKISQLPHLNQAFLMDNLGLVFTLDLAEFATLGVSDYTIGLILKQNHTQDELPVTNTFRDLLSYASSTHQIRIRQSLYDNKFLSGWVNEIAAGEHRARDVYGVSALSTLFLTQTELIQECFTQERNVVVGTAFGGLSNPVNFDNSTFTLNGYAEGGGYYVAGLFFLKRKISEKEAKSISNNGFIQLLRKDDDLLGLYNFNEASFYDDGTNVRLRDFSDQNNDAIVFGLTGANSVTQLADVPNHLVAIEDLR